MANKEKETNQPKTPTQLKKKYKTISNWCFAGQFASVIAPFVVIGIVNFNDYFVEYDGVKMSIGCVLAAAVMGLAVWLTSKKKFTNSYITLIVGWGAITAIFFLIGQAINDISYIMLFGLIGILGAGGLDVVSAKYEKKAEQIQKGIDAAEEEIVKDAYIQEKREKEQKRTIKVKVRKDD